VRTKTIAIVIASVFALSACGKQDGQPGSLGVTADVKRGTGYSADADVKAGVTNDQKAGNTLTSAIAARNVLTGFFRIMAEEQGEDFRKFPFAKLNPQGLFLVGEYGPSAPKADKEGHRPTPAEYQRNQMISIIGNVVSPVLYWPIRNGQGFGSLRGYMNISAVSVTFTKNVYALMLPMVPVEAARNPIEVQKIIRAKWDEIPTRELVELWLASIDETRLKFNSSDQITVDAAGSQAPVHYKIGLVDVKGDEKGFSYSLAGIPMFDDQHINGQKIEIAMDRGNSSTASTGFSAGSSTKADGGKAVAGSVGLSSQ
jgi:hypothetical protein